MSSRLSPMKVVVQSRRVPAGLTEISLPHPVSHAITLQTKKQVIRYDYVLEEGQRQILAEALDAAESLGVPLEVIDLSRAGLFTRIFTALLRVVERPRAILQNGQSSSVAGFAPIGHFRPHQHSCDSPWSLGREQTCILPEEAETLTQHNAISP